MHGLQLDARSLPRPDEIEGKLSERRGEGIEPSKPGSSIWLVHVGRYTAFARAPLANTQTIRRRASVSASAVAVSGESWSGQAMAVDSQRTASCVYRTRDGGSWFGRDDSRRVQ
jgi:hypothetical protein